jgi:hypothetical protein
MAGFLKFAAEARAKQARAAAAAPAVAAAAPAKAVRVAAMLDSRDDATAAVVRTMYEYVEDPAAMIALLYRTRAIYESCPGAAPLSELGSRSTGLSVSEPFNRPHGMTAMNSMLRYSYNYFNKFCNKMNWNDLEARGERGNAIFFHARAVRNVIVSVFETLTDVGSNTKRGAAQALFMHISEAITRMPATPAERARDRAAALEKSLAAATADMAARAAAAVGGAGAGAPVEFPEAW